MVSKLVVPKLVLSGSAAVPATDLPDAFIVPPAGHCFHCGDAVPDWVSQRGGLYALVLGQPRPMCCLGCQLASQSIVEAGLESYYLDRTEISRTAPLPQPLQSAALDDPAWQTVLFQSDSDGIHADLSVSGVRCAACGWLIEKRLQQQPELARVSLNVATGHLRVMWHSEADPAQRLSRVVDAVASVGYQALPFRQDHQAVSLQALSRRMLMRLGVAGLGTMQAMMFAIALYLGDYSGIDPVFRDYLRWVSLGVSLPVVLYAGWPFYQSAWHALRLRTVNMDVPVSIALLLTLSASIYATLSGGGETYFDSVSMFVFFLLVGRFLEVKARLGAARSRQQALTWQPALAHRLQREPGQPDQWQQVPATQLMTGDQIEIRSGETVPCDAQVIQGQGQVSEALLTGESRPCYKQPGDRLIGGSQNYQDVLLAVVTAPANQSQLALTERLMNRALQERPTIQQRADQLSRWFVLRVLVLSALVGLAWSWFDPSRALWAVVAVLVATCPCALSLATPLALSAGTGRLARLGLLITRGHVIETLDQIDTVVLDKTGTLTSGQPRITRLQPLADISSAQALEIATALEQSSTHPVAQAFQTEAGGKITLLAQDIQIGSGGITGRIDQTTYRLGHAAFIGLTAAAVATLQSSVAATAATPLHSGEQWLYLARQTIEADGASWQPLAAFCLEDALRPGAAALIERLTQEHIRVQVLSGDPDLIPAYWSAQLNLPPEQIRGGLSATDKLDWVKQQQQAGHRILMLGDGVNDSPVLAGADVSVAMGEGADLAQLHADCVLTHPNLSALADGILLSRRTAHILRQNLRWALIYNMAVLLPAALGFVPPWLAAIGMSLSSLLVVLNALRLGRGR